MSTISFADGPLFFPVTPFHADGAEAGSVNTELLAEHIRRGVAAGPGGVFPACGTGEFHALSEAESVQIVRTAAEVIDDAVPVIPGIGGPLPAAISAAKALEAAGADGFLLLPPYLVGGTQEGLAAYVAAVADSIELPIIIYHRANAQFTAATVAALLERHPTIAGLKDGVGDVALTRQIVLAAKAVRTDALFFNGLLTAEASQHAYAGIGVPMYSSAIFAAQPEIATAFYRAYRSGDTAATDTLLSEFYMPLVRLRDTTPGYAVSLIKAGNRLRGLPVGGVRPPLVDPTDQHLHELQRLLDHGLALAQELTGA